MSEPLEVAAPRPGICDLPDELLCQISESLETERDALDWALTCRRTHDVGLERLVKLNAARDASGLRWAIMTGNTGLFEAMLQQLPSVDLVYSHRICHLQEKPPESFPEHAAPNAATPLNTAIAHNQPAFVERLLEHGASPDFSPEIHPTERWPGFHRPGVPLFPQRHWRPIHWALTSYLPAPSNPEVIPLLVKYGADFRRETGVFNSGSLPGHDESSFPPLSLALMNPDVSESHLQDFVSGFLSQYTPDIFEKECMRSLLDDFSIYHLLHDSEGADDIAKLRFVLEQVAPLNQRAILDSIRSCLTYWPTRRILEYLEVLLDQLLPRSRRTTILNLRDEQGYTMLTKALVRAEYKIKQKYSRRPIHKVKEALNLYKDMFTILIRAGASPDGIIDDPDESDESDQSGYSRSFIEPATSHMYNDYLRNLKRGTTPIAFLCSDDYDWLDFPLSPLVSFAEFFVAQGARIDIFDRDGKTPMHWAAQNGSVYSVFFLLKAAESRSAILNAQELSTGWTPLMLLLKDDEFPENNTKLILTQLFLNHGADVNLRDFNNQTALHHLRNNVSYHYFSSYYDSGVSEESESTNTVLRRILMDAGADTSE